MINIRVFLISTWTKKWYASSPGLRRSLTFIFRVFRGCDLPETLSEPDQLKSCNAKFLRGMFEVPECDVFLCTGSSGDRMNAKFDQFGQERRNFGVLGLVTKVMQV